MDPLNFNYVNSVYPQNFYFPKYEEFPVTGVKYESANKEESYQKRNENKNEESD